MSEFTKEVSRGERFEFGKNWARFLGTLTEERIETAVESLREKLQVDDLTGKSFLDVGSGSGLFSLAAHRLGARVHSIDYDPNSVRCALQLRARFGNTDNPWTVQEGSVLDRELLESLGQYDVVYSWGVLHHTGNMALAFENIVLPVRDGGQLFVAIYNTQPRQSERWKKIKRFYCALPEPLKPVFSAAFMAPREARLLARYTLTMRPHRYVRLWQEYQKKRGMSRWHDHVDWLGGYPFETARPEEIAEMLLARGFYLTRMKTVGGGSGCNEFVFRKNSAVVPARKAA